jgi:hypothetical protein
MTRRDIALPGAPDPGSDDSTDPAAAREAAMLRQFASRCHSHASTLLSAIRALDSDTVRGVRVRVSE